MDSDAKKVLLPWSMPRLAPSQCHCRVALYDAILRETNTSKLYNSNQHGIVHYLLYLPRGANVILLNFFWSFQHVITDLGSLAGPTLAMSTKSIRSRTAPEEHPTVHCSCFRTIYGIPMVPIPAIMASSRMAAYLKAD
jgi:hypothetical protein